MTVRVRIAPSPTGDPHVGTAYIGLLNWCFAKRHGGKFILRIEDTDRTRCTDASTQAIFRSLKWLGLTYDEGPDVGGDHGPYVQSERVQQGIYKRYADQLVAQGDAYPCFCSAADLDAMRKAQMAAKQPIMYDRRCRCIPPAEAQARVAAGESHVVRMKTPLEGDFTYKDRLRKQATVKAWKDIDDQVLMKGDGWPTYHLAAVVDDHLMGITHVIRAEEWLNSLSKHIWLNQHLGFTPPEYVHVGLLRNADKSKISKRKNPTSLLWYQKQGYLPEALLNFLAQLGHSHPDGTEQFSLAEMGGFFDLDRINVAGPVFDMKKLDHLQGLWFRQLSPERMRDEVVRAIDTRFAELFPLIKERLTRGSDFLTLAEPFYAASVNHHLDDLLPKGSDKEAIRGVLEVLAKALKDVQAADTWTVAATEEAVRNACAAAIAKAPEDAAVAALWSPKIAFSALRVAVTGRRDSPPLFDTIAAIGATRCLERINAAVMKLR
jgi:glutamyl-tRNA synthetase